MYFFRENIKHFGKAINLHNPLQYFDPEGDLLGKWAGARNDKRVEDARIR